MPTPTVNSDTADKRKFYLVHDTARRLAAAQCQLAPDGYVCRIEPPARSLDQNAYQWPYLLGFSQQKQWPVNGVMCTLPPEDWKDVLTAAFENETTPRLASGWDGGIVMLGRRTSKYGKKKFAEWMTWLIAAADVSGITPVFKDGEHKRWGQE